MILGSKVMVKVKATAELYSYNILSFIRKLPQKLKKYRYNNKDNNSMTKTHTSCDIFACEVFVCFRMAVFVDIEY